MLISYFLFAILYPPPIPGPYETAARIDKEFQNYEDYLLRYLSEDSVWESKNTEQLLVKLNIAKKLRSKKILYILVKRIGWTNRIYIDNAIGNLDPPKMFPVYDVLTCYGKDAVTAVFYDLKYSTDKLTQTEWQNKSYAIASLLIEQSDVQKLGKEYARSRIEHEISESTNSDCTRLRMLLDNPLIKK